MTAPSLPQVTDDGPPGGAPIPAHAIVVGLEKSPDSMAALAWAAAEADASCRPLHLLHAVQPALWPDLPAPTGFEPTPAACVTDAHRALADSFPRLRVSWSQPYGAALPALDWASRFATVVVVGTRGRGAIRQVLTGSTAVQLIADGHCPIAIVHGPTRPADRPGPVVLGLEGHPTDSDALRAAFRAAAQHHRALIAVHATDYGFVERVRIEEMVATVQRSYPEISVRVQVTGGDPAELLITHGHRAFLLVLGARGRHETAGAVLGSVSQRVLRRTDCPVLVVRAGTLRRFSDLRAADDASGERLAR